MSALRRGTFTLDVMEGTEVPSLSGYTAGETWNGWACPYFEAEELERWIHAGTAPLDIDPETGAYLPLGEDGARDGYPSHGTLYTTEDGQKVLYAVGFCEWCWSEAA